MNPSADINKLKNYELDEDFRKITYDTSTKNGALLSFIQSLLSQIQVDRVQTAADIDKRTSELLNAKFSSLIKAYLEDDTFLDRLGEYVETAIADYHGTENISNNTAKVSQSIKKAFDKEAAAKQLTNELKKESPKSNKLMDEVRKLIEDRERLEEDQKRVEKESEKATKKKAEEDREKAKSISPFMQSFKVMSNLDKRLKQFAEINTKSLTGMFKSVSKAVIKGAIAGVKIAGNFLVKGMMFTVFGPLAYLFKPLAFIGKTIFSVTKWTFKAVGSVIGFIMKPFIGLFKKHHDKEMSKTKSWILKGLKLALLTPAGMFVLGFVVGSVYKLIKDAAAEFRDIINCVPPTPKELTEEEKKKIEEEHGNFVVNGIFYRIMKTIFGEKTAKNVDEFFKVIAAVFVGADKVEEKMEENKDKALQKAAAGQTPMRTFVETITKGYNTALEIIGNIKKYITESPIYKYFEKNGLRGFVTDVKVFIRFLAKFFSVFRKKLPWLLESAAISYGAWATRKVTISALKGLGKLGFKWAGSAAAKASFGFGFGTNPYVIAGAVISSAVAGAYNAVVQIIKDQWNNREQLAKSQTNQELATRALAGEDVSAKAYIGDVGEEDISIEGIQNMWNNARMEIEREEALKAGKLPSDSVERMNSIGGMPSGASYGGSMPAPKSARDVTALSLSKFKADNRISGDKLSETEQKNLVNNIVNRANAETMATDKSVTALVNLPTDENLWKEAIEKKHNGVWSSDTLTGLGSNINTELFRKYRALFVLSIATMFLNGKIDFRKFMEMYSRSRDPEDQLYKIYQFSRMGQMFSGMSDEDFAKLQKTFKGFKNKIDLDKADKLPIYLYFQNYKFKEQYDNANNFENRAHEATRKLIGKSENDQAGMLTIEEAKAISSGLDQGSAFDVGEAGKIIDKIQKSTALKRDRIELVGIGFRNKMMEKFKTGDYDKDADIEEAISSLEGSLKASIQQLGIGDPQKMMEVSRNFEELASKYIQSKFIEVNNEVSVDSSKFSEATQSAVSETEQMIAESVEKNAEEFQQAVVKASAEGEKINAENERLESEEDMQDAQLEQNGMLLANAVNGLELDEEETTQVVPPGYHNAAQDEAQKLRGTLSMGDYAIADGPLIR